jgi:serine/threonine-protein kinase HipA
LAEADVAPFTPKNRLSLWWLGEPASPVLVGELSLAHGARGVSFQYTPEWRKAGFALSEDLPLTSDLFVPRDRDVAPGAIDDARPDRWGERVIRKFEISPRLSLLEFLLFAGHDRYGALGVSQQLSAYEPWRSSPLPSFDQLQEMAEVVRKVLADEPVPELQRRLVRPGASLGGARPKSLVQIDGQPWVVKFSEGEEINTPLIESATLSLARLCGINAVQTRAIPVGPAHAVAVKRFDRVGGRRIHAISANVALRAAGEEMGYPQLAQLLRRLAPAHAISSQQEELFRRMVFNILLDNTDDHEKNHALLRQPDGGYLLSPAFDVVPSAQGLGYQQMIVGDQNTESSLPNALSQARTFGLNKERARAIVQDVSTIAQGWKKHFKAAGVIDRDIEQMAQYIDGDLLRLQRMEFAQH